ncbi:AAA-domain-containing protein [Tothia fuscella]|uniref:Vesicular-fusion protein SEC18 n=1 Tax=Tothia fuscella TaxID=1048955 RepID=A0A9P4U2Z8_9PEZI|nr:AAA-domain-containing protein [Tothia fuscella]
MFNRGGLFGGGNQPQPDPREQQRGGASNYSRPSQGAPPVSSRGSGGYGYDTPPQQYNTPPPQQYGQRAPVGRQQQPPQHQQQQGGQSRGRTMQLRPIKSPGGNSYAFGNLVAVSPVDFKDTQDFYLILKGRFVVTARTTPSCPPGEIGLTDPQRTWASISMGPTETIDIQRYEPFSDGEQGYLGAVDAEIGFASRKIVEAPYDQEELQAIFTKACSAFDSQYLAPGQVLIMDVGSIPLRIIIKTVQLVDLSMEKSSDSAPTISDPLARGILTRQTRMNFFKDTKTGLNLKASIRRPAANSILAPDFKFEDMGIGGLDTEFAAIFRKAFASRLFPAGLIEQMGIQHVKGMLLYGPPGTGKTLIARQIGKMLKAREPKVINGPEVLNKFVGQSEENIRKLFADAEKEYKERGDESELHIIIFDELDAVCKQRGSTSGGTGVGDSVVNQLLSKLDGVDQLNNILLIGMTNRKDMIDEALLRAGRLEVHLEIGLPDEHGRGQILTIHTQQMRSNGFLDQDVDLAELAHMTKNYSGAEISGLVRAASSFAFSRHIKVGTVAGIADDVVDIKVKRQDFLVALEETKPLFGVAEEEFEECTRGGLIKFSPGIDSILDVGEADIRAVREPNSAELLTTLLHGPPGSGKTALAATLALGSEFPYIKLISPKNMIGMNDAMKVQQLDKIFRDADKSVLSVVVIDDIEGLLDWVPIGPRFSNTVLSALRNWLAKVPPKGRRRLVLATTSERSVLEQLGLLRQFTGQIAVPNVNSHDDLAAVLRESGVFTDKQAIKRILAELQDTTGESEVGVGIKRILDAVTRAKQSRDAPGRFAEIVAEYVVERTGASGQSTARERALPNYEGVDRRLEFQDESGKRMIDY